MKGGIKLAEGKEIKKRLVDADLTLTWLWEKVRHKGFMTLRYDRFTRIIKGTYFGGDSDKVLDAAEQALNDYLKPA